MPHYCLDYTILIIKGNKKQKPTSSHSSRRVMTRDEMPSIKSSSQRGGFNGHPLRRIYISTIYLSSLLCPTCSAPPPYTHILCHYLIHALFFLFITIKGFISLLYLYVLINSTFIHLFSVSLYTEPLSSSFTKAEKTQGQNRLSSYVFS